MDDEYRSKEAEFLEVRKECDRFLAILKEHGFLNLAAPTRNESDQYDDLCPDNLTGSVHLGMDVDEEADAETTGAADTATFPPAGAHNARGSNLLWRMLHRLLAVLGKLPQKLAAMFGFGDPSRREAMDESD